MSFPFTGCNANAWHDIAITSSLPARNFQLTNPPRTCHHNRRVPDPDSGRCILRILPLMAEWRHLKSSFRCTHREAQTVCKLALTIRSSPKALTFGETSVQHQEASHDGKRSDHPRRHPRDHVRRPHVHMEAHQHPLWIAESRLSRVQACGSRPGEVPAAGPKGHALRSFLADGAPRKVSKSYG